jgi:chromosome partitioning protein
MQDHRPPVVALASTKGGVGKTTLAFVLATEFARRIPIALDVRLSGQPEYQVACIDADPNRVLDTALRKAGLPDILSLQSDGETLLPTLRDARAAAGLVLIDLEGSANQAMLYAAGKSDLVMIPAQPSAFDVREALKTADVVRQAADLVGREIDCRVVLTRTPVLRQKVAEHSRAQFERAGLPLLVVELVHRVAFQTMTYTGQPPYAADPAGGAAANVTALADAVAGILGMPVPAREVA